MCDWFIFQGPNSEYFYIREGDGNIMVNKTLDYNKINHFNLTVQAKVCSKIKIKIIIKKTKNQYII